MYDISNEIIHEIMERREKLEVELSKKIENLFWEYPLAIPLRKMLRTAWIWLLEPAFINRSYYDALSGVNGIIQQNDSLTLWSNYMVTPSFTNLFWVILGKSDYWSPSDCSDLIRLWGEVIEAAPPSLPILRELAEMKEQSRDPIEFAKSDKKGHGGYRARANFPKEAPAAVPDHIAPLLRDAVSRGATRCYLMPHDTVKKIDAMYGLPEAMAISGTTTDSIFFIDHMHSLLGALGSPTLAPILHLLPIATMVNRYHHSLLECALALTIPPAEKLDYYIGFYKSLMPHGVWEGAGAVATSLMQVLADFERDSADMHLFAWTYINERRGALFEKHELEKCKELFSVKDKMMAWRAMPHTSTCSQAVNLWKRCCPQLPIPSTLMQDAKRYGHVAF
jgi:hypothetical protein